MQVPELLFASEMYGKSCISVQSQTWKAISETEADLRGTLLSNVVVCGGTSMFEGFA